MLSLPGYLITEDVCENNHLHIYRGQRILDRSPVMIKTLPMESSPADLAKLMHEYEITRTIDLPGIMRPVRLEWFGLTVALIMEDNGDIPLTQYLGSGSPNLSAFLSMAIQLTDTLEALHQAGVIHRNLKLENIFIHAATGGVRIADFSMAVLRSRTGQNDYIPPLAGTMAYMSPEQIGRTGEDVDHRSDFYSLGVVFYELLTGRLPLQAQGHIEWIHAHMAKKPVCLREIKPDIPPALSAIIMKLLAKTAGERYSSALGLLADLEECRRQWIQTGKIQSLIPGQMDLAGRFQLPSKLYGREEETGILTSAFDQVCSGPAQLWLVHGFAGTGKTALINKTLKPLAAVRGYYITGKFDQLQGYIPFAPFIQAFGTLIRQLLTESSDSLAMWKKRLLRALGRNGAVITKVIPEVELVVGSQPPVETLQLWETHNRFMMVFRNFILAFTQKDHPLVIFLDDLQWADPASLSLVRYLSKHAESRHLMLVGAYRDNEIKDVPSLISTLTELENSQIALHYLPLAPLNAVHTNQFVAETLCCSREQSQPLSDILYRKTGGNPFFLGQLLRKAHEEKHLRISAQDGRLEWNSDSIHEIPMEDDVVNLMVGKMQKLPAETLKVIKMAACVGNAFNVKTLAIACNKTLGQIRTALWPSVIEGLILPANDTDKKQREFYLVKTVLVFDYEDKYEFLHDRVQQAAYSLVPEEEKKAVHLQIGRLLLQHAGQDALLDNIFDIMDHFNRGRDLITDTTERLKLAGYNLLAGKLAKTATAYNSALHYLEFGLDLIPDDAWGAYYRLTFDLYAEQSQCEYLAGHYDNAEQLFDLLLAKARTDLEKAGVYVTKILLNSNMERHHKTLQLGKKALNILGVNLPLQPSIITFIKEIISAKWHLRKRKTGDLAGLPEMTDPVQKKVMLLLLAQAGAAYITNPALYALIVLKISNLSIKYGNTEFAPIGYAGYSFFAGSVLGDYKTGREFEQVALQLLEKYDNLATLCVTYFMLGAFTSHWTEHGKTGVDYLHKAVEYGYESGNLLIVAYAFNIMIENKYLLGVPLEELVQECRNNEKLIGAVRLMYYHHLIGNLTGNKFNHTMHDAISSISEDELQTLMHGKINYLVSYNFAKIQLAYLDGDYGQVLTISEKDRRNLPAIRGLMLSAEYIFYDALAITAQYEKMPLKERRKYRKILRRYERRMKKWAENCPANFLHKYLLIAAETARLENRDNTAMAYYDQSIQSAREHGYLQNEALACELAAKFYLARGREKIARMYMIDARQGYERWGAGRKVRNLQERYPQLLVGIVKGNETRETVELLKNVYRFAGFRDYGSSDDTELATMRKAARELSAETNPESLLKHFLDIAMQEAGVDKGFLLLEKDDNLYVEAAKEGGTETTLALPPVPLEKSTNLSRAVVRYVARTLEPAVVNDVAKAEIFARDPYFAQSRLKCVLGLPLLCRGIFVGVLYLENSLMTGVFTPDRLETLKLLSAQMASVQKLQLFKAEDTADVKHENLPPILEPLTERELEVLGLIVAGMSNKEIAQRLYLTISTVKTHILNIYGKLQVNRRVQAVIRAKELKLLKR